MTTKKISTLMKILRRRKPTQLVYEILQLLWGYPLYLLSFICPRDRQKWVFGHKNGFADNAKYLYLYTLRQEEIKTYWITQDKKLLKWMRSLNLPAYHRYSLKGIYHSLTSYLYIYTTSSDAVNFFTSGNSKLVNLWHGVGIKNFITAKSGIGSKNLLCRICMPYVLKKPNYLLVPPPSQREYFKQLFSVNDEQLLDDIYPRCAFLRQESSDILEHIKQYEPQEVSKLLKDWKRYDRVYLYMPTWRANLNSAYLNVAFPDMAKLDEILKKTNALFVIKQHPTVRVNKISKQYDNIYFIDNKCDIYPILPFTDVLITDYSSIYSDYILLDGKGVILYPFDLEEYQKTDLSLINYKENNPGTYVYTFSELLKLIESRDKCAVPGRDAILSMFWGDYKNKSRETLYMKLLNISYR